MYIFCQYIEHILQIRLFRWELIQLDRLFWYDRNIYIKEISSMKEKIMSKPQDSVFETERLLVRTAMDEDIDLYHRLWTNPDVMKHVGFPSGIPLHLDEMKEKPFQRGDTEFDQMLVVILKN